MPRSHKIWCETLNRCESIWGLAKAKPKNYHNWAGFRDSVQAQYNLARIELDGDHHIRIAFGELICDIRDEMMRLQLLDYAQWCDPNGEFEDLTVEDLSVTVANMLDENLGMYRP